jgi:hypothetical protein
MATQTALSTEILVYIKKGMRVHDINNFYLGVVTATYHNSADRAVGSPAKASSHANPRIVSTISGVYVDGEAMPEYHFVRLSQTGFVRVAQTALPASAKGRTYYVVPGQIRHIGRDTIMLAVSHQTLLTL